MKKAIIAASAALILTSGAATCWTMYSGSEDEFFNENLEALLDSESEHRGHCGERENDCVTECPICGELVDAGVGHMGPAYGIYHVCD